MSATYSERGYIDRRSNAAERILETAKRNPEGALLVAAGVCLMMRGIGRQNGGLWRSAPRASYRSATGASSAGGNGNLHDNLHQEDQSRGMMDTMRETASDMTERARQSAEQMAGYADHMRRAASDTSSRMIGRTTSTVQSGMERIVEEQPLALAVLGLAAGAAVAALVPPTRIEERTLGPIGERLTEEAEEAGRRLKESATEAGKRLATEGLTEAARSVFSGDHDEKSHSDVSGSMSSPTGTETSTGRMSGSSASPGGMRGSSTSSGAMPGSGTASTTPASPSRTYENGIGNSDEESGSSLGPGSSETGHER